MIICGNCGNPNEDGSAFCGECGTPLGKPDSQKPATKFDTDAVIDNLADAAGKTVQGAKDLAGMINETVTTTLKSQAAQADKEVAQEISRAQRSGKKKAAPSTTGTAFMSSTELWSWLQKGSKRQHFYTEEESTLTEEEYIGILAKKIADNNVPATIRARRIQWDRSNVKQDIYLILPVSDAVNPLSCLVQFNRVGKFTFVEEKTFITPPDLPAVPQKKVAISDDLKQKTIYLFVGLVVALIGLLVCGLALIIGITILIIGAGCAWIGYSAQRKLDALLEHNRNCDRQEIAWSDAWNNWENSIFLHSFQESVNGQISRIYDAAFECVKQINDELFSQQKSVEESESRSMNELEQLISRRKDNYR